MKSEVDARTSRSFAFGPFVLVPERQLLLRGAEAVRIGGRALELLTALVERSGDLVTKRELIAKVWPDTTVDESNLKVNIAVLRRALEEGLDDDPYIATVVGRGYRFVAPVRLDAPLPPSHNLPVLPPRIFGRADAIAGIRRDLEESRLVSIVGPGGIGKTTVAVAVAREALGAFADGVVLVDLTALTEAPRTAEAIAAACGIPQSPDVLTPLCEFLRHRRTLLVFDTCEHLVDGVASCADRILAAAAGVRILVTSREPMQMAGERVRRLPGLDPSSAVELFVKRASEGDGAFLPTESDAPMVAEICRRLDGLPLAIDLAASRIDAFGVGGIWQKLDDPFRLLAGRRAGPERHRTLKATLDWSFRLLSEHEAALLCAISVFERPFTLEDAVGVGAASSDVVLDRLLSLSAKSWLTTETAGESVTFRLAETTRAHAAERMRLNRARGS